MANKTKSNAVDVETSQDQENAPEDFQVALAFDSDENVRTMLADGVNNGPMAQLAQSLLAFSLWNDQHGREVNNAEAFREFRWLGGCARTLCNKLIAFIDENADADFLLDVAPPEVIKVKAGKKGKKNTVVIAKQQKLAPAVIPVAKSATLADFEDVEIDEDDENYDGSSNLPSELEAALSE